MIRMIKDIIDLNIENEKHLKQTAELLLTCFENSWNTIEDAIGEVKESIDGQRLSRIAVDKENNVIGWIGGISKYDGNVWELHPLVVRKDCQNKGVGKLLVNDFEKQVVKKGGITILLGTDDENNLTTLGGIDIYSDLFNNIKSIRNLNKHPYEFYQKMGYTIVGVIPDANGFGRPDILMAKRVGKCIC